MQRRAFRRPRFKSGDGQAQSGAIVNDCQLPLNRRPGGVEGDPAVEVFRDVAGEQKAQFHFTVSAVGGTHLHPVERVIAVEQVQFRSPVKAAESVEIIVR